MVELSRRTVAEREFGPWQMAERLPGGGGDELVRQVQPLLAAASPSVRGTFEGFMRVERAEHAA